MDESATTTAAAAAGKNTSSTMTQPPTSSLLLFVAVNSAATLVCACLTAFCVIISVGLVGYRRRLERLLTNRLAAAAALLWSFDDDVEQLVQFTEQLRARVILHGVTEFDLFAYKFRVENGVYGYQNAAPHQSFVTLKKLEHLLEGVAIHLPSRTPRCWALRSLDVGHCGLTFGSAVCRAVIATAPAWCDDSASAVRRVIQYVAGQPAVLQFDAGRPSDSVIERRVLATIPYVRALRLVGDRFCLADTSSVTDIQLRDQIVEVDMRLAAGDGASVAVQSTAALLDAYTALRELCIDVGLIRRGDVELPERMSAATVTVSVVRHLIRLSCGTTTAARRTEPDARFSPLMTRLYEQLVGSVDTGTLRAVERRRDGMLAVTTALSSTLTSLDPDFTKTTLEHVERELCRHVSHLSTVRHTPAVLPAHVDPVVTEPVPGPSGIQTSTRLVVSVEEESSGPSGQYTTAVSLSLLELAEEYHSMSSFCRSANGNGDEYLETAI